MTKERGYFRKNEHGEETFNYRAYEDNAQMEELARMRREQQKRKSSRVGLKVRLMRLFGRQKSL